MEATREELERVWCSRLADAKLRLDFARNFVNEVQQDSRFADSSPDGQDAYERALRFERLALAEYRRVLLVVTDLMLEGKVPDETAWQRRKAAGAGLA